MRAWRKRMVGAVLAALAGVAVAGDVTLNIEAQPVGEALTKFAEQSGLQVLMFAEGSEGVRTGGVKGTYEAKEGLRRLLAGTGLDYEYINAKTVAVRVAGKPAAGVVKEEKGVRVAQEGAFAESAGKSEGRGGEQLEEVQVAIPEILVQGSKSLNMDIKRSRDDIQAYITFDRAAIEHSGAGNIQEFFKSRLPMADSSFSPNLAGSSQGDASNINLRGLGVNQTLILIDGHRTASYGVAGNPQQPDLNGIPLSAIERIEILPTTASGIYGGSATGGVVNVVLRRDYRGVEGAVTYDSAFDNAAATRQVELTAGFAFRGGQTNVLLSGSYSDADSLLMQDRDFLTRGREKILANNRAAFFGAFATPPLGYTTNIRSNAPLVNGVRPSLTLKTAFGGASVGSPFTFVPVGYAGPAADNGAALIANAGQYNFDLAGTAQGNGGGLQSLWNNPTAKSLTATVHHEFTSHLKAFLETSLTKNSGNFFNDSINSAFTISGTAASNPFNENIQVTTPALGADGANISDRENIRAVGGFIVRLPKSWQGEADYTWNRVRSSSSSPATTLSTAVAGLTAQQAINNGALNIFRDTNVFTLNFAPYLGAPTVLLPFNTTLKDAAVRFSGPLGSLPGGEIVLSTLIEHRKEGFDDAIQLSQSGRTAFYGRNQSVGSLYVESRLPLISSRNRVWGIQILELQLAARRDDYTTTGANNTSTTPPAPAVNATNHRSSIDPTLGLRFQPISDITFRASYGTGFLPPSVSQLVSGTPSVLPAAFLPIIFGVGTDPRRGNEPITGDGNGNITFFTGGNPDLNPEESRSWSLGTILTPHLMPQLRLSVDWTKIDKTDNISPVTADIAVANEAILPGLVVRAPATVQNDPNNYGVGPIIGLPSSYQYNVSRAQFAFVDMALDYRLATGVLGDFTFSVIGTRQTKQNSQLTPAAQVVDGLGLSTALKWKGNATVTWERRRWTLGWAVRYFDAFWINSAHSVVVNQGSATVASEIVHDVFGSYHFDSSSKSDLLYGTEIGFGIKNVLDTAPPVSVGTSLSGLYSSFGDPRLRSYWMTVRRRFL